MSGATKSGNVAKNDNTEAEIAGDAGPAASDAGEELDATQGDAELDAEADEDEDLVILVAEDDSEHRYILILTVELEGLEYGVLAPEEQVRSDDPGEFELSIFQIEADEDGDQFIAIEDDETFEKVRAACAELLGIDDEAAGEPSED